MKVLRSTVIHPRLGRAELAAKVLDEIDSYLATQPGFVESYELEDGAGQEVLGRVSVWLGREFADRAANQTHTIALRCKLQALCLPGGEDRLLGVTNERHAVVAA